MKQLQTVNSSLSKLSRQLTNLADDAAGVNRHTALIESAISDIGYDTDDYQDADDDE